MDALRGLVSGAYADYTLPLFEREVRDAEAGVLQRVSFANVSTRFLAFYPGGAVAGPPDPNPRCCIANVEVTRTREETRAGAEPSRATATYQFRAERRQFGQDAVSWVVSDFIHPVTGRWVSQQGVVDDAQVSAELASFFEDFYEARTLVHGHPLDLARSAALVAGDYGAYTMALLERSQADAASGALKEVRYTRIGVRVEKWDAGASSHGGLATVAVTRTSLVTTAVGVEPPQLATYEFRVHRHVDETGKANWLAVDFLRPDLNRWVTDLAGATVIVPWDGHA